MHRLILLGQQLLHPPAHLARQVIELLLSQRRLEARTHLGRGRRFERATEPGSLRAAELNLFLVQVLLAPGLLQVPLEELAHLLRQDFVRVIGIQMAPERMQLVVRQLARTLFEPETHHVLELVERDHAIAVEIGVVE